MIDMSAVPAAEPGGVPATTPENLIERFDAGEDVLGYFDAEHPIVETPEASAAQGRRDRQMPDAFRCSAVAAGVVPDVVSDATSRHPL